MELDEGIEVDLRKRNCCKHATYMVELGVSVEMWTDIQYERLKYRRVVESCEIQQ